MVRTLGPLTDQVWPNVSTMIAYHDLDIARLSARCDDGSGSQPGLLMFFSAQRRALGQVTVDDAGTRVRKHFLPLEGLGVRDLSFHGDDLFILAGPTMVLNGDIRVFRWPGARQALAAATDAAAFHEGMAESMALPHGRGTNRAEALCELPGTLVAGAANWLVLYDAPGDDRREGDFTVFGDRLSRG
jgi:hypothetical protein